MSKIIQKYEANTKTKREAFAFQIDAVESIKDLEYAAVFHEQGLGKSKIAIDVMLYWIETKAVDTVFIVTKKGLIKNWVEELAFHTFLSPRILEQNKSKNFYIFNSPSRLVLTHYEVFESEFGRFKLYLKTRDVGIIIDESAKIKNPSARLTQCFHDLAPLFKKRIIMTGTPAANRPYDIWSQIYFLDQGRSLGDSFKSFKRAADMPDNSFDKQDAYEKELSMIYDKIRSFAVRETKNSNIISLPKKIIERIETDWEKIQYDLYRSVREDLRATIIKDGVLTEDQAEVTLKRLLRLVQITSNPALIDESYKRDPGKFAVLESLIEQITDRNEKCIVWTSFVDNADWLNQRLSRYKSVKVHGRMSITERNRSIDRFKYKDFVKVLVATPASAKEGLTLTVANHVIFFDRSFSLDDYLQAQDRIHRISQERTCYVYNLIMTDSIDEWVDSLLAAKHLSAQLTQGDISLETFRKKVDYSYNHLIKSVLGINNEG
jgi:SNF2 family DNA or RNA helicase